MMDTKQNSIISIRPARKGDKSQNIEIASRSFGKLYRFFAVRSLESEKRVVVAEIEGKIAGFMILRSIKLGKTKIGYIFWIAVHPDHRRRGIAGELIRAAINRFIEEKADVVYASIEEDNLPSEILFKKQGFSEMTRKQLWNIYGPKTIALYLRLFIAPHELIFSKELSSTAPTSEVSAG